VSARAERSVPAPPGSVTPDYDRIPTAEETARLQGRQSPAEYVRDLGGAADWTEARERGFWPPPPAEALAAERERAVREPDARTRAAAFTRLYPQGPWKTPLRAWELWLPGDTGRRARGLRGRSRARGR
jgi:hypothetical protein